nr:unnamed protein product [Callosobruchus chinensis]
MSNRPICVAELERRRLATAASLSKDLEAITAWGLKNMVEFNASKTQHCALSNKRCPCKHSVLMNNQALPRSHSFKHLGVNITENMIWHEYVSSIATAAGKKLGYLFRARKYFSPSNLLTLYKAQIRPSLEYCSHIWGAAAPTTLSILDAVQRRTIRLIAAGKKLGYLFRARKYSSPSNLVTLYKAQIRPSLEHCSHIWGAAAPTTLSILDAVQRRAIRLIGDPALICHLQPLSHRRAVGDLSLFYRYSN